MLSRSAVAVLAAMLALGATRSGAGVLERVRHTGVLHCGAEPRAGVAEDRGDGALGGVAVELCRTVARSVLGPAGKVAFRIYESPRDFAAVRRGRDELSFLTQNAIVDQDLARSIVPGPAIFTVRLSLLVAGTSPARRPQDLAGQPICFMIASDAEWALDAAFRRRRLDFLHMGFEEAAEMSDAYAAHRCVAMAGEAAELVRLRSDGGVNHPGSRVLSQPMATFAVVSATPAGDEAWSSLLASRLTGKPTLTPDRTRSAPQH